MPRQAWFALTLLNLLFLVSEPGVAQSSMDVVYTVDDGLPSNTVYDVIQDEKGYIWMGTDAGLSRFDGYEFTNYSLEDGLPDVEILKFFKDSRNRIWMYTFNGKVGYLQNDSIYSSQNDPALSSLDFKSRITSIIEIDSSIYFSDKKFGIKRLNPEGQVHSVSIPDLHIGYLCYCEGQLYWLLHTLLPDSDPSTFRTSENSMYVTADEQLNLTPINEKLYKFTVGSLGYLYCHEKEIVSHHFSLEADYLVTLDSKTLVTRNSSKIGEQGVRILSIEQQEDRMMVFATSGIFEYNHKERRLIKKLSLNNSTASITDQEGNQWISTLDNGVHFKAGTSIKKMDLGFNQVSIMEAYSDQLYVLHDGKYLSVIKEDLSSETLFEFPEELNFSFVTFRGDSAIVVALEGSYLIDLKDRKLLRNLGVDSSCGDDLGDYLLFADLYAKMIKLDMDSWETEEIPLPAGRIHDMMVVNDDSILFSTDKGLQVLKKSGEFVPFIASFPEVRVSKLLKYQDQLWMTTSGQGVMKYENDSLISFSTTEGMRTNLYKELMAVDDGIWASTSAGMNKINFKSGKITEVSSRDGLNVSNINDMILFQDRIYLAQDNGLFYFPKDENFQEISDFHLFIDKVTAENDRLTIKNGQLLPYNIGPIKLTAKAPIYRHKSSLTYQFRLKELASSIPGWTETVLNQFNFSGLSPGSYEFEVRAKTKNSQWTSATAFNFVIVPAYWQTLWFKILIGTIILTMACLIFYSSTRNNRLKRKLEKDRVTAEITALKAQINPHFLFNALNSIQSFLLSNENDLAEEYLVKYSKLMRKILDHSSLLTIPIQEEIETIQLYVDLEKYRARNSFRFKTTIDEEIDTSEKIPSMILQPIVENAIWHGLSNNSEGVIQLNVKRTDAGGILLMVSDNGRGFDPKTIKSNSKGSNLVKDRLALLNQAEGIKSRMEINTAIDEGTTVSIWVAGL